MSWLFPSRVEEPPVTKEEFNAAAYGGLRACAALLRDQAEDEYCFASDAYRALTVVLAQ